MISKNKHGNYVVIIKDDFMILEKNINYYKENGYIVKRMSIDQEHKLYKVLLTKNMNEDTIDINLINKKSKSGKEPIEIKSTNYNEHMNIIKKYLNEYKVWHNLIKIEHDKTIYYTVLIPNDIDNTVILLG